MRTIELDASQWVGVLDLYSAMFAALGVPDWHGASVAALIDTMVWSDEINMIKPPYRVRIVNAHGASKEVTDELGAVVGGLNRAREEFRRRRGKDSGVQFEIA